MPPDNGCERSEEMVTIMRDLLSAEIAWPDASTMLWPWSYRIAGALSSWPAVEIYEADRLLDVVSSTRLAAPVLRGGRYVRMASDRLVAAWGRLPPSEGVPAVEFSGGRRRRSRQAAPPVRLTDWCWVAVTCGPYDAVSVSYGGTAIRRKLRAGQSWP
jgi:hypothetical protein